MDGTFHNGEIYRRLRNARKLTQAQLAAKVGISGSTLRRIEQGGKKHTREHEDQVAAALGTSVRDVGAEVARINQALAGESDDTVAHTADAASSRPAARPAIRGDNVLVFPTKPEHLRPSLTVWLRPPDWRVVRRIHAEWSKPLIPTGQYVGKPFVSFWRGQSETAAAMSHLMTQAWDGTPTETYYRVSIPRQSRGL